jgi:exodeoxyribonuclease-5
MLMEKNKIKSLILKQFAYKPTAGQNILIDKLSVFINTDDNQDVFVIKGYAGTGKTTIISALVNILPVLNKKSVLLAPTGRSAKVLSNYSNKKAFTIHKKIYKLKQSEGPKTYLILQKNFYENTMFIVDESSMIPSTASNNNSLFSSRSLLDDLIEYVYQGENCKLILIGDSAQLPPVGTDISPALDMDFLKNRYNVSIDSYELTDVVRQSQESGILANATDIRNIINNKQVKLPLFSLKNYTDIIRIDGYDFEDQLNNAYSEYGLENTTVICRSNKQANSFNQGIRDQILFKENEISAGDYMMIVKNNYFWLSDESKAGFMANGDIIEILKIRKIQHIYGFDFADVTIRMVDYPDENELDVKIILDTIMSNSPSLSFDDNGKLYKEVLQDYISIKNKRLRYQKIMNNPYFNALQVKFAYSLTCHKTQGGQWDAVFVDKGYINEQMMNVELLRWLYTAVTRANKKLFLINFNEEFFN